jgi:hypothetical protein
VKERQGGLGKLLIAREFEVYVNNNRLIGVMDVRVNFDVDALVTADLTIELANVDIDTDARRIDLTVLTLDGDERQA